MLGAFRLLLALLVALSHADVRVAGLNPGVIAVVCFYLISGYVMTGLLRNHYSSVGEVPYFYMDRALRVFPQYFAIAGLTLAWFLAWGQYNDFLTRSPEWPDLVSNFIVVPINYHMFSTHSRFTLIPPAWSLGAEIQFYLLIPFVLLWRLRAGTFLIGLSVFLAAAWGAINTDIFGYRLLPGVLIFFLIGSALYDARKRGTNAAKNVVMTGLALVLLCAVVLSHYDRLMLPYNRETLLGIAIGLPLLYFLTKLPQNAFDNRLGDLSYGVFLNHFLIQWTFAGKPVGVSALAAYLGVSLLVSMLTQRLIERPALRWRHRIRRKH